MAQGVIDIDRGYARIMANFAALNDPKRLTVGVHQDAGAEMVLIALSNEFGTSTIPARSFIRATIARNKRRYLDALSKAVMGAVIDGDDYEGALQDLGEGVAQDIRDWMVALDTPPNAPSTIAQKGEDNPLVDSGALQDAISAEVR
ncbi:MAG: hypothetical protein AAFV53_28285 [Myxococcota bacterium]